MDRISKIIHEIESDFVKLSREKELPLKEPQQIKAVIWNLLTSEQNRKIISYNDYLKIMDVWLNRLIKSNEKEKI
jgi:hypothetical protein